jgi:hypothetical protein
MKNIVDFFMFFYNGKTEVSPHGKFAPCRPLHAPDLIMYCRIAYIEAHVKKFIDQKDRDITHRYQFYKLNAYLVRESNWTVEAWADLLDDFVEMVWWKFQGTIFCDYPVFYVL